MPVVALRPYEFAPADAHEKFHGNQLLYVGWEDHLLLCAPFCWPLPPSMPFQALLSNVFPGAFGLHPEFAAIDWSKAEWFKSGKPWQPQMDKSLAENGLKHKDVLRFRTPGLTGIKGSCS